MLPLVQCLIKITKVYLRTSACCHLICTDRKVGLLMSRVAASEAKMSLKIVLRMCANSAVKQPWISIIIELVLHSGHLSTAYVLNMSMCSGGMANMSNIGKA